jgi:hypothetical protein
MGRPNGNKASAVQFRSGHNSFFGVGKPLPNNKFPLVSEVGRALVFEAEKRKLETNKAEIDKESASQEVTNKILDIYKHSSIPTKPRYRVVEMVRDLWRMRRELVMHPEIKGKR